MPQPQIPRQSCGHATDKRKRTGTGGWKNAGGVCREAAPQGEEQAICFPAGVRHRNQAGRCPRALGLLLRVLSCSLGRLLLGPPFPRASLQDLGPAWGPRLPQSDKLPTCPEDLRLLQD